MSASKEIESIIRIEARTKHSSPHGKDNPETFAYIAGATKWAAMMEEFAEWVDENYMRFYPQDGKWYWGKIGHGAEKNVYTTSELLTKFITSKQQEK